MLKHWKKISSKVASQNSWWTYRLDEFQIPGGIAGEYHYVHTEGSSLIVPVMDDGKIILVNQYRYLCAKESIEFPCGGVKIGKSYEEMAHLELEEEAGYVAQKLQPVAEFNPFNGVTDEMCKVFIARELKKTAQRPDATEEIEVLYKTPDEIENLILTNAIWDGMTIAAWGLVKNKI
ncbi:MAG: NUDIX hydrolase [Bacteroidota bacterium]|nr:NUDIX hydrolase [Bacteroidota bacterium]